MKRGTVEYYSILERHERRPGEEKHEKRYDLILQNILERHGEGPERKNMKRGTIEYYRIYWRGTGEARRGKT